MPPTDVDFLSNLVRANRRTVVVDAGANPIDGKPPYDQMLSKGLCSVVGFEPQLDALARLETLKGPNEVYLPYALGDGNEQSLRICRSSGMSSLKDPDSRRLALFNLFSEWGRVTSQIPVLTRRLDDIEEVPAIDFLKMDVQGSELDILNHGKGKLSEAVFVQTEMSFVPLYKGQPTFGQVDVFLREVGFIPHCFAELKVWPLAPTVINNDPRRGLRQLLEADLVYVRDFTSRENMTVEQWKHVALLAHHVFNSVDLAARAIGMLDEMGAVPKNSVQRYFSKLRPKQMEARVD